MKRSPRRPLILKRRKLPFQRNDQPATAAQSKPDEARCREAPKPSTEYGLPDGVRIMDHPTMRDTQVVVMPRKDLQNVIGALTAKGRECGPHGPNKFILLSESSFREKEASTERSLGKELAQSPQGTKPPTRNKPLIKESDSNPLDDSLTNIQWLGKMNTDGLGSGTAKGDEAQKENVDSNSQMAEVSPSLQEDTEADVHSKKPPYSYMVMIQFAINSKPIQRMTLKEIYTWIEDHFPYFRHAKPGWKNSIRHNLSLHNMFVRDTAVDNRVSYWTIRPEANRCLTLDQVYKPGCDLTPAPLPVPLVFYPCQRQNREAPVTRRSPRCFERRMKPLLPRADSYLVPIQLPVASSYYLHPPPSSSRSPLRSYACQRTRTSARGSRRVRIAPKVSPSSAPPLKEGQREAPPLCPHPRRRGSGSSRRKQVLVQPQRQEEPVLLAHSTLLDSGVVLDISSCQDLQDTDQEQEPSLNFSFKTPIKGGCRLTSSTPSRPAAPSGPWREAGAALSEEARALLDFSPIRTPSGPAVTPQRPEYHTYSFSATPFKDLPLFSSPTEMLLPPPASPHGPACSRELLRANRSLTEGLVLDTVNDSLSKVLVDISFSGLEDEELSMANISWSQFLPLLK